MRRGERETVDAQPAGAPSVPWRSPTTIMVLAAVLLALVVGVHDQLGAGPGGGAGWRETLAPLAHAPIPPGAAVAIQAGVGSDAPSRAWAMEAQWRRPDVRWALASDWPPGQPMQLGLAVGLEQLPPDWREVWREGDLVLAEPAQ